jgi:TolB protein
VQLARLVVLGLLVACKKSAPAPALRVVLHEDGVENAYPRLSRDGREVLYQSKRSGMWQLYVLDLASNVSRPITDAGNNNLADWSPDEQRIAFVSDRDGNEEIYVTDRHGKGARRLTRNAGRDLHPYWSPDGATLLYNSEREGGSFDVYAIDVATGREKRITSTPQNETCARYAPDGRRIVLLRNSEAADDVWILDGAGEHDVTRTPAVRDGWPMFGADGWVYFASMEPGPFSIYRVRADGSGRERLTTPAADEEDARPFISTDGKRLIFNRKRGTTIDIMELTLG